MNPQPRPGVIKAFCYVCERYFTFDELDQVDYRPLHHFVVKPNSVDGPAEYGDSGSIVCAHCGVRIDWINV